MPCEDTGLTVGLKPGLTIALAARSASEHTVELPELTTPGPSRTGFIAECRSQRARAANEFWTLKFDVTY